MRLGLEPENVRIVKTIPAETEHGSGGENDQSTLFSDNTPIVTLVGTSYSADPKWNFEGYLKEYLQTDVLNAAEQGLGPFETMKKYLQNESFLKTPPKLVIWEIPERYLTFEYDLKTEFYSESEKWAQQQKNS
jgi:alginate O-acetyltransferase complex protein AlgJ